MDRTIEIILGVALIAIAVFIIACVLSQSSKEKGLSGALGGGNETFFSKSGAATRDRILSRITVVLSVIFVLLVIAMYIFANTIYG